MICEDNLPSVISYYPPRDLFCIERYKSADIVSAMKEIQCTCHYRTMYFVSMVD